MSGAYQFYQEIFGCIFRVTPFENGLLYGPLDTFFGLLLLKTGAYSLY